MKQIKKIVHLLKEFDYWFDVKFGLFFVNGRKADSYNERLIKRISERQNEKEIK
jgi:hypothetical protein